MDNTTNSTKKKLNYILLTKITLAIFGIICTGLGIFGLFGLTKVHLKQSKTEGKVINITIDYRPNTTKTFIYTFEYTPDDGMPRQFEEKYTNNAYMPDETITVWYFNDTKEANAYHNMGWIIFGIFMPIGLTLILVDIFAIKNTKKRK